MVETRYERHSWILLISHHTHLRYVLPPKQLGHWYHLRYLHLSQKNVFPSIEVGTADYDVALPDAFMNVIYPSETARDGSAPVLDVSVP